MCQNAVHSGRTDVLQTQARVEFGTWLSLVSDVAQKVAEVEEANITHTEIREDGKPSSVRWLQQLRVDLPYAHPGNCFDVNVKDSSMLPV